MKNYQFEKKASFTHILQRDHREASPLQIKHSKHQDPLAQSLFSELFSRGSTPRQKQKSFSKALLAQNQSLKSRKRQRENYNQSATSQYDFMNKSKQILKQHFDKENQDRNLNCHNACPNPPVSFVMLEGEKLMLCKACSDNLTRQGFQVIKIQPTKQFQPQRKTKNDIIKLKMIQLRRQLQESKQQMLCRWQTQKQSLESAGELLKEGISAWLSQLQQKLSQAYEGDLQQINLKIETIEKLMSRSSPKSLELADKLKSSISAHKLVMPVLSEESLKFKLQNFLKQLNLQQAKSAAECQTDRSPASRGSECHQQQQNQQQIQGIQNILTESQQQVQLQARQDEMRYVQSYGRLNMSKSLMSMENPLDWHE